MIRRPPRSTLDRSSAASDVYKRQFPERVAIDPERVDTVPESVETVPERLLRFPERVFRLPERVLILTV